MRKSYKISIAALVVALLFLIFDIYNDNILNQKWILCFGAVVSLILNVFAIVYQTIINIKLLNKNKNTLFDVIISIVFIALHAVATLYTSTLIYILIEIFKK